MNGYLLDTHIWLWSLLEPERLSKQIRTTLLDEGAPLYLSSISVWEAILLGERSRVIMSPDPTTWVRDALARSPIAESVLNREVAICSRLVKTTIQDPADRFIIATAKVFDLTLVTADQAIRKCKEVRCI